MHPSLDLQEAVDALGPEVLAALVGRMLLATRARDAAARGFATRLELGPGAIAPLAPASDPVADVALSMLLLLVSACDNDDVRFAAAGLEALAQQVNSQMGGETHCVLAIGAHHGSGIVYQVPLTRLTPLIHRRQRFPAL